VSLKAFVIFVASVLLTAIPFVVLFFLFVVPFTMICWAGVEQPGWCNLVFPAYGALWLATALLLTRTLVRAIEG